MIYGGLDLSLLGAAYSKYDTSTGKMTVNKINGNKFGTNYRDRNFYLVDELSRDLSNVNRLFVEDYAFNAIGRITAIAEVMGAIKYNLRMCGMYLVSPNSLKKALTGHGHSDKKTMISYIKNEYGILIPDDDDMADSIALLLMAMGEIEGKYRKWIMN